MTWPRNIARRSCPFCDWYIDDAGPTIDTNAPVAVRGKTAAQAIQDHVASLVQTHAAKVERILQEHLDSHVREMISTT